MRFSGITLLLLTSRLLFVPGTFYAEDFLSIEVWCELQPMDFEHPDADASLDQTEAFRRLFEEARQVAGAMIYGYRFTYIPSDKARGVSELFEILPIAEIKEGDPNLKLISRDVSDNRLYGRFSYRLEAFQRTRCESWQTIVLPVAWGRGEGRVPLGGEGKRTARETAVREAVRNLLRPRLYNKPREIRGETVILENPHTNLSAGTYRTTVKVKIDIKDVIPYSVF
jgi:hypothetical protein